MLLLLFIVPATVRQAIKLSKMSTVCVVGVQYMFGFQAYLIYLLDCCENCQNPPVLESALQSSCWMAEEAQQLAARMLLD